MTLDTLQGWHVGGRINAAATMAQMRANTRKSLGSRRVIETARAIVASSGAGDRDELRQARAVREWLCTHFRFVKDPLGVELLETPAYQLQRIAADGTVRGDCDDAATLAAALCLAIGIPVRFVSVAFGSPTAPYTHVFAIGYPLDRATGKRTPVEFDVTRPAGFHPPPFSRRLIVPV